jgi:hypothetical protein
MSDILIRNVRDPDQGARGFPEAFLGRELAEEEQVTVMALPARPAPCGEERKAAVARLSESVKAMSERAQGIPQQEMEALIDEAVEQVRGRRQ